MALARKKRRMGNLTHGDENGRLNLRDTVDNWSSIPNASVGKSVEKSIRQVIRDGGVKRRGPMYQENGKDIGMEITTKKGNKTQIKDLIAVKDIKKKRTK